MAFRQFDGDEISTTLADLKSWMQPFLKKGVVCPCCKKNSRVYTRKLTHYLSVPLIIGWRAAGIGEWIAFKDLLAPLAEDEDIGKWFEKVLKREAWWRLAEWQLVVPEVSKSKKCRFAITALGEQFVKGEVKVPAHYYEYNRKNVGWMWLGDEEIKYITIVDSLGKQFNWKDLMP